MANRLEGPARTLVVSLCLFGSGFCALVYQMTWLREFRLIFGTSTAATAAVLTIFMGGLGFGSILLGKRVDRDRCPLQLYGKLELLVALSAAITPLFLWLARTAYIALGGATAMGTFFGTVVRLLLAGTVLAVPTFLLGGTLPAAVRAMQSGGGLSRCPLALLYGVNTLGAVTGTLLSTFILFERLGNRWTFWSACAVNLALAVAALKYSSRMASTATEAADETATPALADNPAGASARPPVWFVLGAAAVVGFAFFLMELVWYRMLSPLLGGSTYTFGLILATALGGIALGSLLYSRTGDGRHTTLPGFALVCALEALFIAIPYALGDRLVSFALAIQPLGRLGFTGRILEWSVLTFIVVFPAALFAGMQFPMLAGLLARDRGKIGAHTGSIYGWNTFGAIFGSLAGGFGLLPVLTAPGAWRLVVAVLVQTAVTALVVSFQRQRRFLALTPALAVSAAALLLLTALGPTAAWRHTPVGAGRIETESWAANDYRHFIHDRRRDIFWEAEGRESSIAVAHHQSFALMVNGKSDGNARGDAGTQVMLGILGALLHPHPTTSLVIGLGTGSSAGWLADVPAIERVDVVELEPAVIQVAGLCSPVNRNVLANPKVHIHIGDAREFVLTSRDQYDLIASEPSNPYRAGVASLFTREFYQAAAKRLRPGGLFVQWVQAYEVNGSAISTIYATIASVFPGVETWRSQSGDMLLIGTRQPLVYDVASLRRKIQEEPFRSALASVWRVTDLEGVLARHLGNSGLARAVAARQRAVNTDDRNRLEYAFASTVGSSTSFSLEQLAHICREEGFNQPALSGGAINGEAVADRGASAQIVDGGSEALSFDSPGFRSRTAAKTAFLRGDLGLVLKHWFDQTQPPGDLVELLMVASSLAAQGDDRAPAYIERLRAWFPSEADAVMARYLCRKGRVNEGMELFEKAFLAWRDDPWPAPKLIRSSMSGAVSLALTSHDAGLALRLQQALQVPFAVHILEGERLENLLKLARRLDAGGAPRNIRALISSWEPDVPWTIDFLNVRASCYTLTGDSRAAAARGDLEDFKRSEGEPLAYARRGETNSAPEGGFTEGLVSTLGWLKVRASGK